MPKSELEGFISGQTPRLPDERFACPTNYHTALDLASVLINRSLSSGLPAHMIPSMAKDSLAIYSCNATNHQCHKYHISQQTMASNLLDAFTSTMSTSKAMQSYLRPSFRQLVNLMTSHRVFEDSDQIYTLIDDIRVSFDSLCIEDRKVFENFLRRHKRHSHFALPDACFVIYWSIIEAVKYCFCQKFAPGMSANNFISSLQSEISRKVKIGEKLTRRLFLQFLQQLDKFLVDRIHESSTNEFTLAAPSDVEKFFKVNRANFQSWLLRNRQPVARLALIVDDPAECWRSINHKLFFDLATKFLGSSHPNHKLSFMETLKSLKAKNWGENINLIAISAKLLHDPDLLEGIRCLTEVQRVLSLYKPLKMIISNLGGRYGETLEHISHLNTTTPTASDDLGDQCLVEILNASIELGEFEKHVSVIERLECPKLKRLYKFYEESRELLENDGNQAVARFDELEKWLSSWSDMNDYQSSENDDQNGSRVVQPVQSYLDLVVTTNLNLISQTERNSEARANMIDRTQWILGKDFIAQCLFPPNHVNEKFKIFHILLEQLRDNNGNISRSSCIIDRKLVESHASDLKWNYDLYRYLKDLKLIEQSPGDTSQDNLKTIDLVRLRATKFLFNGQNFKQALSLANQLIDKTKSEETRLITSLLVAKRMPKNDFDDLNKVVNDIKLSSLGNQFKSDLYLKVLRNLVRRDCSMADDEEINLWRLARVSDSDTTNGDVREHLQEAKNVCNQRAEAMTTSLADRWSEHMSRASITSQAKTMITLCRRLYRSPSVGVAGLDNHDSLNKAFRMNIKLLSILADSGLSGVPDEQGAAIESGTWLLAQIRDHQERLSGTSLDLMGSADFIVQTKFVWIHLRSHIVSLLSYKSDLLPTWRDVLLSGLLRAVVEERPELFVYDSIVNRRELSDELRLARAKLSAQKSKSNISLTGCANLPLDDEQQTGALPPPPSKSTRVEDLLRQLELWNGVYQQIKLLPDCHAADRMIHWPKILLGTESFVKQARKMGFLLGDYVKWLCLRLPHKLSNFKERFKEATAAAAAANQKAALGKPQAITSEKMRECRLKLCHMLQPDIDTLAIINGRDKESFSDYEKFIMKYLGVHLRELEYRLGLLVARAASEQTPTTRGNLTELIMSVIELLTICDALVNDVFENLLKKKIYVTTLSEFWVSFEADSILMPGHNHASHWSESTSGSICTRGRHRIVTLSGVSHTVTLICSLTNPKKLSLKGSDGLSRPFLLKVHEDLRFDQLVMDVYAKVNWLLASNKKTRSKYQLRNYSVTPLSPRSGLIEWIDATSICTAYRTWLACQQGKQFTEQLYSETCQILCDDWRNKPQASHPNCQPPLEILTLGCFHQLLWARAREAAPKCPLTQQRPSGANSAKYRAKFEATLFEGVVGELERRMPQELLANYLWQNSNNSHQFWRKTQNFIGSCACNSMVGYMIGLGDRHTGNILLNHETGELIHIDYDASFDIARLQRIPEQVPFRLTPVMIRAMGFAGLEGPFSRACVRVLDVLRAGKETILHHFNPLNLTFKIHQNLQHASQRQVPNTCTSDVSKLMRSMSDLRDSRWPQTPVGQRNCGQAPLELCSQESLESSIEWRDSGSMPSPPAKAGGSGTPIRATLEAAKSTGQLDNEQAPQAGGSQTIVSPEKQPVGRVKPESYDLHDNIKAPTKYSIESTKKSLERMRDKLSGADENIRHYKQSIGAGRTEKPEKSSGDTDLIVLNDTLTTEEQVEALIAAATSIKNRAAMYEGFTPWL